MVIVLRKEETGVLVMVLSEHLWPEDLGVSHVIVREVSRARRNPLLLLVEVIRDFDTPPWDFLSQILQPGILPSNRPARVAVLTANAQQRESSISDATIRFFRLEEKFKAKAWLLSLATPSSLPPILG